MPHSHTDLLRAAVTVAEVVGPDRVEHSQFSSSNQHALLMLDSTAAVDEFAAFYDGRTKVTRMGARDIHASSATVNGVTVHVQASEFVTSAFKAVS